MAVKDYDYTISTGTANGAVATDKLSKEIKASAIVTGEDHIQVFGDTVTVWMKDTLSAGDETILNDLITAHDGIPEEEPQAPTDSKGSPIVSHKEPEGESQSIPTHDFTDRTTWYMQSIRVEGETPILDSGLIYDLVEDNIIDVTHGKVTRENHLESTYCVKVYDGGTALIETDDFTVDFLNGKVTLISAPTGALTADYSYENGSSFIIEPSAGMEYKIKNAEIQFTSDVEMIPVEFELWMFNQDFDPNLAESESNPLRVKIPSKSDIFKSYKDIINIAKRGTGTIGVIHGFTKEIMVFPFHYDRVIGLKSSQGLQLRVRLVDETPMVGEWGTMTFYVIKDTE